MKSGRGMKRLAKHGMAAAAAGILAQPRARRLRFAQLLALLCLLTLGQAAMATETVVYYHTDALGSPVAVTDASGNVIERSEYEPYGKLLNRPLEDGPGYTGHVSDAATGLSYMQQRYYDPEVGMMLSVDPVTAYEKPFTNFCRYCYARSNPYKFVDPDGRLGEFSYGAGVGISPWLTDAQKSAVYRAEAAAHQQMAMSGIAFGSGLKQFAETREISKQTVGRLVVASVFAIVTKRPGAAPYTAIERLPRDTARSFPNFAIGISSQEARSNLIANGFKWVGSEKTPGAGNATKGNVTYNFYPASRSTGEATMKLYVGGKQVSTYRFRPEDK